MVVIHILVLQSFFLTTRLKNMSNPANFQDWETVVLKKQTAPKSKGPNRTVSRAVTDDFDPETAPPPTWSNHTLGAAIQQARTAKGMKQAELDQACNLPKNTTSQYESGKAVYNAGEVNKIARTLGVTLPRPTKAKAGKVSKS